MTAAQDAALQGGAIVLAFASYSMATDVALALVIVLALAIVLALQSAIEPNFIPPEIKQRALPQTRPYDDCKHNWALLLGLLPLDASPWLACFLKSTG